MKFLVDVCAGGALAVWLQDRGHDVVQVRDRDGRMTDREIIAWAHAEGRAIITADKDFGELAVAQGLPHSGMVRLPDVPRAVRLELMVRVLERHQSELLKGAVITVSLTRIRVRFA